MNVKFWSIFCLVLGPVVAAYVPSAQAQSDIAGKAVTEDPVKKLERRVAALEQREQQLEQRVLQLERHVDKPDAPDDDDKGGSKSGDAGKSSAKNGSSSSSGGDRDNEAPRSTVTAPFQVVDKSGKVIFEVRAGAGGHNDARLYGGADPLVDLSTGDGGGALKVLKDGEAGSYVIAAATNLAVGLKVRQAGSSRVFVGAGANGGTVLVYPAGREDPAAFMSTTPKGAGLVGIDSSARVAVAFMTESTSPGGGNITTTDPAGNGIFSAGYDGGGDGAACVDRKQHLHCLGIGLPLSGN